MINLQVLYVAADPFSGSSQIPFLFWKQNICHHACFLILLLWSLLTLNYSFFLVLIFVLFLITSACHFKKQNDHDNSFLIHVQLLISRKTIRQSIRQYTSHSSVRSPLQMENSMKSISAILVWRHWLVSMLVSQSDSRKFCLLRNFIETWWKGLWLIWRHFSA